MIQAARQPTLSRVAETRPVLGKQKRQSSKKAARKPSNLRQRKCSGIRWGRKKGLFL